MKAVTGFAAVVIALVLQVSVFPHFAWQGVVPNLCLLVVVAAGLARGPEFAACLGFVAGILLDLAPPADHVAGRWALALVIVGFVVGAFRPDSSRFSKATVLGTVGAASFIGTSIYAISGLILRDPVVPIGELLTVIVIAIGWDLLFALLTIPWLIRVLDSEKLPDRVRA